MSAYSLTIGGTDSPSLSTSHLNSPSRTTASTPSSLSSPSSFAFQPPSLPSPSSSRPTSSTHPPLSPPDARDPPSTPLWPSLDPLPAPPSPSHTQSVRHARRLALDRNRRMLDRRTVIDVKRIRERKTTPPSDTLPTSHDEERKILEARAEAILRPALRPDDSRHKWAPASAPGGGEGVVQQGRVEETKEQLTMPEPTPADTFITATQDVQLQPSASPQRQSFQPTEVEDGVGGEEVGGGGEGVAVEPDSVDAYRAFIDARVHHMLVSNGVFIPVPGGHLVNSPVNALKAVVGDDSSGEGGQRFHLPSLQAPVITLPASASITLASSDERHLYQLLLFLSRIPLLASLPLQGFFALGREVKEVKFDEFEVIANEGEQGDVLYFVKEGRIDTKLNLERQGKDPSPSPPPLPSAPPGPTPSPPTAASSLGPLRRRFHSINLASLDVSCLTAHDVCGESIIPAPHVHLTSLIAMTPATCYAIPLATLLRALPAGVRVSLGLYTRHSLALTRTYLAVRDRYRSSYHTSVVDFRLFVEGSLRRNLRHKNERGRMRKEIEAGGGGDEEGGVEEGQGCVEANTACAGDGAGGEGGEGGGGRGVRGGGWGGEGKDGEGVVATAGVSVVHYAELGGGGGQGVRPQHAAVVDAVERRTAALAVADAGGGEGASSAEVRSTSRVRKNAFTA